MPPIEPLPVRYEPLRLLGAGGMGRVWLALDREAGEQVAVKRFAPGADADVAQARVLFQREFWALSALRHPALVGARDWAEAPDGVPCFAMPVVPGRDLAEILAEGPQPEAAVRTWLPDVLAALAFLHGRGQVHGDLKPENVRVLPDGRGKLMDLGLLHPFGRAGEAIRGTLRYMAPELCRGAAVDGRADLYALGIMLFEALAGRPPFDQTEPLALLRAHVASPPAPLPASVSPPFAELVARLLAKDPAARPADAGEVLAALGLDRGDQAAMLFAPPTIGRTAIEAALAELATDPNGGEAAIAGPAGSGKSRLLGELRAVLQLEGRQVLCARGLGADAPPYQALAPWLRALAFAPVADAARLLPLLARVLPADDPAVGRRLAALDRAQAVQLDAAAERHRLFAALAELAAALPDVAWLLDDADQLDPASAALAAHLRRTTAGRPRIWLEAHREAPPGVRTLVLGPLPERDLAALAEAMMGGTPPAGLASRLAAAAGGQPGPAEAVLTHWVRSGAIFRRDGGWTMHDDEAAFELPGGLAGSAAAPLAGRSPAAVALARAAAVLGSAGELAELLALARLPESEAFAALDELEVAGLLARDDGAWRFVAPARAGAISAGLPAADAAALHDRAADLVVAADARPDDPALPLARVLAAAAHRLAGSAPETALPWVAAGARRAIAVGALDRADALLRRALEALPAAPALDAARLLALRTLVLRLRGEPDTALALGERAIEVMRAAGDPALGHELVSRGILLQMKSRYAEAMDAFRAGIAAADAAGDAAEGVRGRLYAGRLAHFEGKPGEALGWLGEARERARALAGGTGPAPTGVDPRAMLAAALSLGGYLLAGSDPALRERGLAELAEAIALARAIGDEPEAMDALSLRGNVLLAAGRPTEAAAAFAEGLAIGERLGLTNETLFFRLNLATSALERGRIDEALAQARAAVASARAQGRRFPESYGLALEGAALVARAAPASGLAGLEAGLRLAREIGNRYVELPILALRAQALLTLGRLVDARAALSAARALASDIGSDEQRLPLARAALALAAFDPLADEDELAGALAALEAAGPAGQAAAASSPGAADQLARAHARRWAAAIALEAEDLPAAAAALAEGEAAASAAGLDGLAAELTLLRGRLALARGEREVAARLCVEAAMRARELGQEALAIDALAWAAEADPAGAGGGAGEAAAAFMAFAAELGDEARAAYLAHPERGALFRAIDPSAGLPLARLRRLAELVADVGQARGVGEVMQRALAGFAELAEADRAFLLLYDGLKLTDQAFWGMQADEADAFSSALAFKALWSDEPIWVEDITADAELGGRASVQALSLRSALGVPLHDGERTIGVVLADSRRPNPRFGPAEREVARALAAHTAAALTAARGREASARAAAEHERLWAAALALAGAADRDAACRHVAAAALARLGGERALVLLGPELRCVAAVGSEGAELEPEAQAPSGTVARWVFERGEAVQLLDAQDEEALALRHSVLALGLRAIAAAPIAHAGERLGVLYVDARRVADPDAAALDTLSRLGELLGAALERG